MKHRFVVPALFCALVFFLVPHLHAQEEGSIKQAMSPEEFHRAGLDKLSDEELRNLDRWLRGDREKTAKKQANTDDRFRGSPVDHPGAAVIHGIFGYKMRVEGVPEFYVDPVRR